MSQENLDAVRRAAQAFNEGDVDRALELYHPEAVYYEPSGSPIDTREVLRGVDQLRETVIAYMDQFPDFRIELDELVDAGDKVVSMQRWSGTGGGSGAAVELEEGIVHRFENGKVIEARVYPDRASALEAVGLAE